MNYFLYDLFMDKMVKTGAIDKKVFSLSIAPNSTSQSVATFGGYDSDKFATDDLTWHDAPFYSMYWSVNMDYMSISIDTYQGEQDHFTRTPAYVEKFGVDATAIVDSGTSYIYIPETPMSNFLDALQYKAGTVCQLYDDYIPICSCDNGQQSNFPDMTFSIGKKNYTLSAKSYVTYYPAEEECILSLMTGSDD